MRMKGIVLTMVALLSVGAAQAFEGGDNEVEFDFSYVDTDDVGKELSLNLLYGWFLTENHEVGALLSYFDFSSDFDDEADFDGGGIGAFYRFNFGGDNVIPFVGANVGTSFGDLGDAYDLFYGVEGGARWMIGDSAAVVGRIFWQKQQAAEDFIDDADSMGLSAGISIHY